MESDFFLRGILLGLSIAAPVGPIGVLCIRRTLAGGRAVGLATGLGAATADLLYGAVVVLGITHTSAVLVQHGAWLRFAGGALLCYLGASTFLTKPNLRPVHSSRAGLWKAYVTGLFLTLSSPVTILFFAAVLTGMGAADAPAAGLAPALLVLGTFLGSSLWWIGLTSGIHLLSARFNEHSLRWLNRVAGIVVMGFGASSLLGLLK